MRFALILPITLVASASYALPPGTHGLREGANHRVGDDSFVAVHGRAPNGGDTERERMKLHLQYVRSVLTSKPATKPELEAKRTELLAYLDDYIAKGITPLNTALPWRSPVFIDDFGNICAVGYLIERSVGREVAEAIAKTHRYDYLEDIAAALPEARAWVEASGFTLDELASIQPGYNEPAVESWRPMNVAKWKVPDGEYERDGSKGKLRRGRMEGAWKVTKHERLVGKGTLYHGSGTWTSFYPDGKRMGRGPIARNTAHGEWTLYHPSGNVAARGRFTNGERDGSWQFYYDTASRTPIARGSFSSGTVRGTWRHYDTAGNLLAVSKPVESWSKWEDATLMTFTPDRNGVHREVHRVGGVSSRHLDGFYKGNEKLYVLDSRTYDANGYMLTNEAGTWRAADCGWGVKRKTIARNGDVTTMHKLLRSEDACGEPKPIGAARAKRLDELLAAQKGIRVPTPAFVKQLVLNEHPLFSPPDADDALEDSKQQVADAEPEAEGAVWQADDLARILVTNLSWYIEWPHIDGRFMKLHATMPGYRYYDNGMEPYDFSTENGE